MLFNLSHFWIIFLNIFIWVVIHLGISYFCSLMPLSFFSGEIRFFKTKRWESGGKIYQKFFKIKRWKKIIPDGGSIFKGGFPKKHLEDKNIKYLKTFFYETKRAELTHWLTILPSPIFFLWNIWWAGIIMIFYALLANIPCILLQRYNRARLEKII
jgi:glycosyl-4,4'-diaponeurosporenoate acyltransferase